MIEQETKFSLGKDLSLVPFMAWCGTVAGVFSAIANPFFVPNLIIKEIRNEHIDTLGDFTWHATALASYGFMMYKIGENMVENPENPLSYIPLATNILSGAGQMIYRTGKRKSLENKTE